MMFRAGGIQAACVQPRMAAQARILACLGVPGMIALMTRAARLARVASAALMRPRFTPTFLMIAGFPAGAVAAPCFVPTGLMRGAPGAPGHMRTRTRHMCAM
jgi:hypothetical protein